MSLPEPLTGLFPEFDKWTTADIVLRMELIYAASAAELSHLVDCVLSRLSSVDAYLGSFGDRPLDDAARRLLLVVESALDARQELDARTIPRDDIVTSALVDLAIESVEPFCSNGAPSAADRFVQESDDGH